jgi:tryptophan 7-halogenase|tara:strand:- start:222 stop:1694 length:1473 start_codon:yes stop_codon:yes gene_type:complete
MIYRDKNITILGGGTAGWLTSLYCKKIFPHNNITLIESKRIGILGAGEGSTPMFPNFLKSLDIDIFHFLKHTGGTIKLGINFENWNGDNKNYFHGFNDKNEFNPFKVKNIFNNDSYNYYLRHVIYKNLNVDDYVYAHKLALNNKIDLNNCSYALHFDASKTAEYLKDLAIKKGVNHHYGELKTIESDKDENITKLIFEDNYTKNCDFVFDCTGFNRLIIGKHFKSKWVNYQKHLPIKKAIPFFLEQEEQIRPYTQATAMKNGWLWKIPLQHRFGAGYIYDSDYITDEEAVDEVETFLNQKIKVNKVIQFEAGRYEKVWIKNCISIGLSSGFTEPIEATSIHIAIEQLIYLTHFISDIFSPKKQNKHKYNDLVSQLNDKILNFLYLHYITKRNDSLFWKQFRDKNAPPKDFDILLDRLEKGLINFYDFQNSYGSDSFSTYSWLMVGKGLEIIKDMNINGCQIDPSINEYKSFIDSREKENNLNHIDFLKNL